MAEIKSTLDLVMERTKHLIMSTEERFGQQKSEFEKRLNGLLQQYDDTALAIDELMAGITALQKELNMDDHLLVVLAVMQRIQPDLDNEQWLLLIKELAPAAYTPLKGVLTDYGDRVADLARSCELHQQEKLSRDYAVQGSAVVSNLYKDARFQEAQADLKNETVIRIKEIYQGTN